MIAFFIKNVQLSMRVAMAVLIAGMIQTTEENFIGGNTGDKELVKKWF